MFFIRKFAETYACLISCRQVDVSKIGTTSFEGPDGTFEVEVIDSTEDYLKLMKYVSYIFLVHFFGIFQVLWCPS